jgi:ribonuclease D
VLVVENPAYISYALQALRASMQDPIIAIDLEWRPEFGRRFTPVAMVQLASSRLAVLIRTCRMSYKLPAALKEFLRDDSISLLGFGWASSDEGKMTSTFGVGCKDFGRFLDLQAVAQGLGYCGFGLARLTSSVLGLTMPKSKKISMSNWEVTHLTMSQVGAVCALLCRLCYSSDRW